MVSIRIKPLLIVYSDAPMPCGHLCSLKVSHLDYRMSSLTVASVIRTTLNMITYFAAGSACD
jgi:hypothetical protein